MTVEIKTGKIPRGGIYRICADNCSGVDIMYMPGKRQRAGKRDFEDFLGVGFRE